MQKRIGSRELTSVDAVIEQISLYQVLRQDRKRNETFFNHLLYRHVAQIEPRVTNKGIHSVTLVGETFRPEFCIRGKKQHPLFCIECKKLTDITAKGRFKAGLSQALLYSSEYKMVALVFYDYTNRGGFSSHFHHTGSPEESFITSLWRKHRIKVIFIVPR